MYKKYEKNIKNKSNLNKKPKNTFYNKYKNRFYSKNFRFNQKNIVNFGSNIFSKGKLLLKSTSSLNHQSLMLKKFSKILDKSLKNKNEVFYNISTLRKKKINKKGKILHESLKNKNKVFYKISKLSKKKINKTIFIKTPKILTKLFYNKSVDYLKFDTLTSILIKNQKKKFRKTLKDVSLQRLNMSRSRVSFKKFFSKLLLHNFKVNSRFNFHSKYSPKEILTMTSFISNKKITQLLQKHYLLLRDIRLKKSKLANKNFFNYLKNESPRLFTRLKRNRIKLRPRFFIKKSNTANIKSISNFIVHQFFTKQLFQKILSKKFYMKYFKRKYSYDKNIWRYKKPYGLRVGSFKKALKFNDYNTYLKYFNLYHKNILTYRKAVHFGERRKIRYSILANVPFERRKRFLQKYINKYPWYRRKFVFKFLKTNRIIVNKTKTKFSYFFPWRKRYYTRFMAKRFKYSVRNNHRFLWKKNWKKMKLNKKQYFPKRFIFVNLSKNNFKRQDSFRLLHNFRTIFLKYMYKYPKIRLPIFKKLKNHFFINTSGNNFIERFLWQLERSVNILMYRSKYIPHIKIANHLVRYGFVMVNNKTINNPYSQANIFDILRISKLKYFKRIFLTQFNNLYGIRRRQAIPNFIETNKKILALSVYRKPKIKDFVKKKIKVLFGPDKSFYASLPIIAALF